MSNEELVLRFLFEKQWNDEMKNWWSANLMELIDICPPEIKDVNEDNLAELLKTSILRGLKKVEHSFNKEDNFRKTLDKELDEYMSHDKNCKCYIDISWTEDDYTRDREDTQYKEDTLDRLWYNDAQYITCPEKALSEEDRNYEEDRPTQQAIDVLNSLNISDKIDTKEYNSGGGIILRFLNAPKNFRLLITGSGDNCTFFDHPDLKNATIYGSNNPRVKELLYSVLNIKYNDIFQRIDLPDYNNEEEEETQSWPEEEQEEEQVEDWIYKDDTQYTTWSEEKYQKWREENNLSENKDEEEETQSWPEEQVEDWIYKDDTHYTTWPEENNLSENNEELLKNQIHKKIQNLNIEKLNDVLSFLTILELRELSSDEEEEANNYEDDDEDDQDDESIDSEERDRLVSNLMSQKLPDL